MEDFTLHHKKGKLVLVATTLASGMAFLAGTLVSIALPTIQSTFSADINKIQWIANGFLLALSALILISGALGDQYGRKKLFLYGISIFTAGSLFSALSGSINQLIFFQVLQGVGAALMIPESLAIINSCFVPSSRGKAIGYWAGISAALGAVAPYLGGWLVDSFGWPSVFYFSVPLGVIVFAVAFFYVPESSDPSKHKLDWSGTILLVPALVGIVFGLIQGPIVGWTSVTVIFAFGLGVLSLFAFLFNEAKAKNPLIPLAIFKNKMVLGANFATLALYFALQGTFFFLVLNLQQVQGYGPDKVGLLLLPATILIAAFAGPAGGLADKIGPRRQLLAGPLVVAAGMSMLAMPTGSFGLSYLYITLISLGLLGLGMAFVIAPITKSALSVKEDWSGVASGINNAAAGVAGLLAIAILGVVVVSMFSFGLQNRLDATNLNQQQKEQILQQKNRLAAIEIPESFGEQSTQEAEQAVQESFLSGFRVAMFVNAALAVLASIISYFTIKPKIKNGKT